MRGVMTRSVHLLVRRSAVRFGLQRSALGSADKCRSRPCKTGAEVRGRPSRVGAGRSIGAPGSREAEHDQGGKKGAHATLSHRRDLVRHA